MLNSMEKSLQGGTRNSSWRRCWRRKDYCLNETGGGLIRYSYGDAPPLGISRCSNYFLVAAFSLAAALVCCLRFLSTFLGLLSPIGAIPFLMIQRGAVELLISCAPRSVNSLWE